MTRSESKRAMLRELGAVSAVGDALDCDRVPEAVGRARSDVIVHQLTLPGALDVRHLDRAFGLANRLRTEDTDLLSAGQAVLVPQFLGRLVAREAFGAMMTDLRSASNARAKLEPACRPAHSSHRRGFAAA